MVGPEHMKDPDDNNGVIWVTIELPVFMKGVYSDVDIMQFVVQQVRQRKASVYSSAQHCHRYLCLSLPVNGYILGKKDEKAVMDKALEQALWWLCQIREGKVHLDRTVLFP
jgi:hypothetical protein